MATSIALGRIHTSQQRRKQNFAIVALMVASLAFCTILIPTSFFLPLAEDMHSNDIDDVGPNESGPVAKVGATNAEYKDEGKKTAAVTRIERMKLYKERYKYEPPIPYSNHGERDEICGVGPNYNKYFHRERIEERSANDEDKTIYELLFKSGNNNITATRGSIVELGAFNGIRESNSRFFDTCLGWNTLLIEGNPSRWYELVENRPHSHRLSFAPSCSEEDELLNKTVQFYNVAWTNAGLADGSVKTAFTNHSKVVDVPCGSLTKVLEDIFPGGHVSFFSLDVEGAEPLVLRNINFDKVFIEVFIVENQNNFCNSECKSRDEFREIMKDNGYMIFPSVVTKSDLFIHPLSRHLETMTKKGFRQ